MKGELIIRVKRAKSGKEETVVHKDLMLDLYKEFIHYYLLGAKKYGTETDYRFNEMVDDKRIDIGTGTTSPTRSDTALATQVASTTSVTTTVGATYISFSASITVSSAYDITEAALEHHLATGDDMVYPGYNWRLLTRDTFSAVTLSANDTISITVKLNM